MNQGLLGKHMECFRCATYHIFAFDIVCTGAWECNHMPFLSRPVDVK